MHQRLSRSSSKFLDLVDEFKGYSYQTDYHDRPDEIEDVRLISGTFNDKEKLLDTLCGKSYSTGYAYIGIYLPKKSSKAFLNARSDFEKKLKDYNNFKNSLDITYGRKSSKVTCPRCGSNISLAYGKGKTCCPVCHSSKIISDSNWKKLKTKKDIMEKASEKLSSEVGKLGGTFICGFEYHC